MESESNITPKEMTFWEKIKGSLDNHSQAFSARKLSALAVMLCIIAAHGAWLKDCYLHNDFSLLTTVLTIDYAFICTCLGMTTIEKMQSNKLDKSNDK